jgi:hypothetical protein
MHTNGIVLYTWKYALIQLKWSTFNTTRNKVAPALWLTTQNASGEFVSKQGCAQFFSSDVIRQKESPWGRSASVNVTIQILPTALDSVTWVNVLKNTALLQHFKIDIQTNGLLSFSMVTIIRSCSTVGNETLNELISEWRELSISITCGNPKYRSIPAGLSVLGVMKFQGTSPCWRAWRILRLQWIYANTPASCQQQNLTPDYKPIYTELDKDHYFAQYSNIYRSTDNSSIIIESDVSHAEQSHEHDKRKWLTYKSSPYNMPLTNSGENRVILLSWVSDGWSTPRPSRIIPVQDPV